MRDFWVSNTTLGIGKCDGHSICISIELVEVIEEAPNEGGNRLTFEIKPGDDAE